MKTKSFLSFVAGSLVGGYGLQLYNKNRLHKQYDSFKTESFRQWIEERELTNPELHETYLRFYTGEQFFDNLILTKNRGLSLFRLFVHQPTFSELFQKDRQEIALHEKLKNAQLYCVFACNASLQGHSGVVHGGLQATIIDQLSAVLSQVFNSYQPVCTKSLQIRYLRPLYIDKEYLLKLNIESINGKKTSTEEKLLDGENQQQKKKVRDSYILRAEIVDEKGQVCTSAETNFVSIAWGLPAWENTVKALRAVNNLQNSIKFNSEENNLESSVK